MIYIDEFKKPITENGEQPDWSVWKTLRTEEIQNEDGTYDVRMVCAKFTQKELDQKELSKRAKREAKQKEAALRMLFCKTYLSDEDALEFDALYSEWEVGSSYATADICRHNGLLYRAKKESIGADDNAPGIDNSIWKQLKKIKKEDI